MLESSPLEKLRDEVLRNSFSLVSYRLGQVLTIIDACIADPEQRKAIKDLIKNAHNQQEFWSAGIVRWLWEYAQKFKKEHCRKEQTNEYFFKETGKDGMPDNIMFFE